MNKQETLLIADDADINRALLRNLFEDKYNILEAENGAQALVLLKQYSETIAAVLLDLVMPEKSGYQVLEEMRLDERLCHVPVIVITADGSSDSKVKVFELGATDIINKPFDADVVKSRVKNTVELGRYRRRLESLVAEQSARARESSAAVIDMLSSVIEHRNMESGQHIRRIRMFTKILLQDVAENYPEYNLDERHIGLITDASSMHDIGKIAIPDSILNKPGRLTPEEREIMKTHTTKGCEILSGLDRLQDPEYLSYAYNICRYHHERWDGNGYPEGLRENSIPLCAQVVSIADCYDALTTDRVYKKAIPHQQAYSMILNGECGAFSPRLLECFKNVRDAFAGLAKDYADGARAAVPLSVAKTDWDIGDNTLELSQQKYFTLLRHMNCTVMEADLSTGVYHLVYLADQSFSALKTGSSFEESIRNFAETAVHPQDREEMLRLTHTYIEELFDRGLSQRQRTYRVLDRGTGAYRRCRASVLRLHSDNPRRRRVLLLWKTAGPAETPDSCRQGDFEVISQILGGIQKCRNDRDLTILQMNYRLLDLLGYREDEIRRRFHNRYTELIYPADREKLAAEIAEQQNSGTVMEVEYRLTAKDGRIVWVSDRFLAAEEQGEPVLYCVILDVTRSHQAEEELRLSLERHNIILSQTNDIIFEWDIQKDELYFSSNWEEKYGYTPITKQVREQIPRASHIHPADVPIFIGLMDAMTAGVPYKEIEFRIADAEGKYRWRRVRATAQFDADGKPFKAVGVLLDIDSQKQAAAELENRAARDVLTKLYNKASAQEQISTILAQRASPSALMVLDIDNFKELNDRYGHMFGDAVLVELSAKISGLFRGADVVSRIGGDEFMIFMPDIQQEEVARQRAEELIEALRSLLDENVSGVRVSCSVGLAFSPGPHGDYHELFKRADRALYSAKAAGKNRCMSYRDEMEKADFEALREDASRRSVQPIDAGQRGLSELVSKSLEILYNVQDFNRAVQTILALVGETLGVSRVYIFDGGGDVCSNTFEWCRPGTEPMKEQLQNRPYILDGRDYRDNFDDNGIFYCPDITKLCGWQQSLFDEQNILSTLQFAVRGGGRFQGFIGLDDCKVRRIWTKQQIDVLTFEGKLLAAFLMQYLKDRPQ